MNKEFKQEKTMMQKKKHQEKLRPTECLLINLLVFILMAIKYNYINQFNFQFNLFSIN